MPLFDSQVAWLANQNMNYLIGGEVPGRMGTAHPNIVPYQAFPTADGHIMIAVGNDRQFASCMRSCGMPELADDVRFQHNRDRLENREALVSLMSEALRQRHSVDWLRELTEADVPCSPIDDLGQVFAGPYATECELVRNLDHASGDKLPTVANPVRFSESPVSYERAPPLLGEHSNEVLIDWLGYSDAAIERLRKAGTI